MKISFDMMSQGNICISGWTPVTHTRPGDYGWRSVFLCSPGFCSFISGKLLDFMDLLFLK